MNLQSNWHKKLMLLVCINLICVVQMIIWDANAPFIVGLMISVMLFNGGCFVYYIRNQQAEFLKEKKLLTHRVEQVGHHVFDQIPLGIILYDQANKIVWSNSYAKEIFNKDIDNLELASVDAVLFSLMKTSNKTFEFTCHGAVYAVDHHKEERVFYFDDITNYAQLISKYEDEQATLGLIVMDNFDEVVKHLDEQAQNDYRRAIVDRLSSWANEYGVMFKTVRDGRYLILMRHQILTQLCQNKFTILDDIRGIGTDGITLTISMGIASGYMSYVALFNRASSLVDLALSRGGDQIVVKKKGVDDFLFYGGKTNPIASQNRVRARVNAGAYERLILDSDQVVIMGHKFPDADAIGASIGLLKIATTLGKVAHIVLNKSELDKANEVFVHEVLKDEKIADYFISSMKAVEVMTKNSLLVIADTQSSNLVIDNKLLCLTNKIAIFDHHRRSADFIEATLSYTDPSVSSTAELVVDMLDYFSKRVGLTPAEASIMLSGIMLDTRRFMYNTSKKTYEAAAILKQKGADEKYVSKLLKAPIDHYYARAHLTHRARVFADVYLISSASDELIFDRTEIAATADDLLNVQNIKATFVLGLTHQNEVAISARSIGEINVQLMMEALGGGGHLTHAAALFNGTVEEATTALETVIQKFN
ncbi:MAG: DHH family phosphoesterase [Defluviitaleaceae bacterium]|nr:DHH family phosphoesterase [Defluviitaleaceae bacterium]